MQFTEEEKIALIMSLVGSSMMVPFIISILIENFVTGVYSSNLLLTSIAATGFPLAIIGYYKIMELIEQPKLMEIVN